MSDKREIEDIRRITELENKNVQVEENTVQQYDDFEQTHINSELRKDIEAVLNVMVRPKLSLDGGDVEVVELDEEGTLWVSMLGECHGCPSANETAKGLIETELVPRIPEIKAVEIDDGLDADLIQDALNQFLYKK